MADDAPAEAGTNDSTGRDAADLVDGGGVRAHAPDPADGNGVVSTAPGDPAEEASAPGVSVDGAIGASARTGGADEPAATGAVEARAAVADGPTVGAPNAHPSPAPDTTSPADAAADGATVKAKDTGRQAKGGFLRELLVLVVIALALAVLIRTFLVQAFFIPSGSMEKTLHGCPGCSGDKVLVNKLIYDFRDPKPGDIVVFRGPPSWESEVQVNEPGNAASRALRWLGQTVGVAQPDEKDFVKRVIAVGGQTVRCCDANGRVTVDGKPLDEPYVFNSLSDSKPQEFGPVTVPKDRLWVMGDHRDGSADSRAHIDDGHSGTVPVDDVIGKAFVIVWPPSRWNTLGTPPTFHNLSAGPLADGVPLGMGLVGSLPVMGLRRRRARRRARSG